MNAFETALYGQLAQGTALVALLGGTAIFNGQPPRTAAFPWVQFTMASGVEENMTPIDSQRVVYLVKGVAQTLLQAGSIADALHLRLHHATLTVAGSTVFWAARETIVRYQEINPAGYTIGHAGGEYAFRLENAR